MIIFIGQILGVSNQLWFPQLLYEIKNQSGFIVKITKIIAS